MVTAGEIADFARDYFESPNHILTPETDLVFFVRADRSGQVRGFPRDNLETSGS
jgi:hypothetical protein